jgi:hypothetical protein
MATKSNMPAIPTNPTGRLRFVKRQDGKLILQQLDALLGWHDVPTVQAPMPQPAPLTVRGPFPIDPSKPLAEQAEQPDQTGDGA